MADAIETWRILEFNGYLKHLLQQGKSKFRSAVMEGGGHKGKSASVVEQVGEVDLIESAARAQDIDLVDIPLKRRWVAPTRFRGRKLLDELDEVEVLLSPKSGFAEALRKGANRKVDAVINTAFGAAALIGENGTDSQAFDTTNQRIAHGSVGMTVNKVRQTRQIFELNDVDFTEEEVFFAISPRQKNNLLAETQVNSKDYNQDRDGKPVLVKGELDEFMGFKFITSNRLTLSSTTRSCYAWLKSRMYIGFWKDIETRVDWIAEKGSWQVSVVAMFGATRLEEKGVVEVQATE